MIKTEFEKTIIGVTSNDRKDNLGELFADLMTIFKSIEMKFGKPVMLYLLLKCVEHMEKEEDKNNEYK